MGEMMHRPATSGRSLAVRFRDEDSGTFAVVFAVAATLLMIACAFAINTAQLLNAKMELANALDAAVTSTARDLTTGVIPEEDVRSTVEGFVLANIGSGFVDTARVTIDDINVDRVANTVSASASVNVPLAMPTFGEAASKRVGTANAAAYSDTNVEVALMLDVTKSMDGHAQGSRTTKLEDLQEAATDAVQALLAGVDPERPRIRVALVPYSNAVNVGEALAPYVHYETRFTTGRPPAYSDVQPVSLRGRADTCSTERKGTWLQFSNASPYEGMVNRDSRLGSCPNATVIPLTADADALTTAIGEFEGSGVTAGHIGIQWTWYMLSNNWARVLPKAAAPAVADKKRVTKIAILMTDGEFNTAYAGVPDGERLDRQGPRSRDKAKRLCEAMRDDGIEVFTIGFALTDRAARETMADCASRDTGSVRHHYQVADGDALAGAFDDIIRSIQRLHLTK